MKREKIIFRPIKISGIKSNLTRRVLIITLYPVIVSLGIILHAIRTLVFSIMGLLHIFVSLFKNGVEVWANPTKEKDNE